MGLVRGWERHYAPDATGGSMLSRARLYREIGEEDGLGEGEIRVRMPPGELTVAWRDLGLPIHLSQESQQRSDAEMSRRIREERGTELDDPNIEVEQQGPDHWKVWQNLKTDDSELGSPIVCCRRLRVGLLLRVRRRRGYRLWPPGCGWWRRCRGNEYQASVSVGPGVGFASVRVIRVAYKGTGFASLLFSSKVAPIFAGSTLTVRSAQIGPCP